MTEHGTPAGYWRHWRAKEDACAPCKAARSTYVTENRNSHKRVRELPYDNAYTQEMDAALAENEPVIKWAKGKGGVRHAVEIDDPHTDHRYRRDGAA